MEAFAKHVFTIIQTDNYDKLVALQPDFEELKEIISNSALSEDEKQRELTRSENQLKQNIASFKKSFEEFKAAIEEQSINIKESSFDYIDFKHLKENKMEKAEIAIHFKFKGADYSFKIKDCVRHSNAWLLGSSIDMYNPNSYYNRWDY